MVVERDKSGKREYESGGMQEGETESERKKEGSTLSF